MSRLGDTSNSHASGGYAIGAPRSACQFYSIGAKGGLVYDTRSNSLPVNNSQQPANSGGLGNSQQQAHAMPRALQIGGQSCSPCKAPCKPAKALPLPTLAKRSNSPPQARIWAHNKKRARRPAYSFPKLWGFSYSPRRNP